MATEQVTDTSDRIHGPMAQRIRRLTSNQKIGGSNHSVVDFLFDTKESSYKESHYKGQHLATKKVTDTNHRTLGPTSDFESEEWGFESFCGRLFAWHKGNFLEMGVNTRDSSWQLNK